MSAHIHILPVSKKLEEHTEYSLSNEPIEHEGPYPSIKSNDGKKLSGRLRTSKSALANLP
jgi:hypothetical protein